jgi:drug/metabolite transporter (DMT)-like permease
MTYLVPPVAVLLGWALLGEAPPWLAAVGGALCLGGVALARRTGAAAQPSGASGSWGAGSWSRSRRQ